MSSCKPAPNCNVESNKTLCTLVFASNPGAVDRARERRAIISDRRASRLDGPASLVELGWDEACDDIVLVEWPDRLGNHRPADALTIVLRPRDDDRRDAELTGWPDRIGGLA